MDGITIKDIISWGLTVLCAAAAILIPLYIERRIKYRSQSETSINANFKVKRTMQGSKLLTRKDFLFAFIMSGYIVILINASIMLDMRNGLNVLIVSVLSSIWVLCMYLFIRKNFIKEK
jgi:UDP-N-acetylmuramyl pentapeptide phosphotransferase/UDP-N-acetylglucosamine-1-phosphate transferase